MKIANLTTILATILAAPGGAAKEKHHGIRSLQEESSMSMIAAEDVAPLDFLFLPTGSTQSSKSSKMNTWNPVLLGPDAIVPLTLACFESNGYLCSVPETISAAYRDKDDDDRLKQLGIEIIMNQNSNGGKTAYIIFDNGQAKDPSEPINIEYDEGYPGDFPETYLLYCCSGPQFVEGGQGTK